MLKLGEQDINPVYLGETLIGKGFAGDTLVYNTEGGGGTPTPDPSTWPNKLKILCIGNSHTVDSWAYVPFMLKQYNKDCLITLCYHGGATLDDYIACWDTTTHPTTNKSWRVEQIFYIDTTVHIQWQSLLVIEPGSTSIVYKYHDLDNDTYEFVPPKFAVELTHEILGLNDGAGQIPWDIICIQNSFATSSWLTLLQFDTMFSNIEASYSGTYKRGFTFTHAQQQINANTYINQVSNVLTDSDCDVDLVFPCGTAIHNLRAVEHYRNLVSRCPYRNLYEDTPNYGVHINGGLPCYTTACVISLALFNEYGLNFTLRESINTLYPDSVFDGNTDNGHNIPQMNGHNCGVDDNWLMHKTAAINMAHQVLATPYTLDTPDTTFNITFITENCEVRYISLQDVDQGQLCPSNDTESIEISLYGDWNTNIYYIPDEGYTGVTEKIVIPWSETDVTIIQEEKAVDANTRFRRYHTKLSYNVTYYIKAY